MVSSSRWWWGWWWSVFVWNGWPTNRVWDHCQRFSPSEISDTPRTGFEPALNLISSFFEWSFAVVITTSQWHYPALRRGTRPSTTPGTTRHHPALHDIIRVAKISNLKNIFKFHIVFTKDFPECFTCKSNLHK